MNLTDDQKEAVEALVQFTLEEQKGNSYFCLIGHSGSGKTTSIRGFIEEIHELRDSMDILAAEDMAKNMAFTNKIMLTATTNKAAKSLSSATMKEATTVHSALGLFMKKNYTTGAFYLTPFNANNQTSLEDCILIIDEVSMMDKTLMRYVDELCKDCKIILVGDDKQLKPVGSADMPAFNKPRMHRLTQIIRQDATSNIPAFGQKLRKRIAKGNYKGTIPFNDVDLIHCDAPEFGHRISEFFKDADYSIDRGRVLTWTNARAIYYNGKIRALRHSSEAPEPGEVLVARKPIQRPGSVVIAPTDSMVTIYTSYETTHKDLECYAVDFGKGEFYIPKDMKEYEKALKIFTNYAKRGNGWTEYFDFKESFVDLRPVYSGTIHTAQGSTYDDVFIDLNDMARCKSKMDIQRLLYVAVTRARNKVYFYGSLPGGTS